MLSAARCDACNATIPLHGALASFALPPRAVTCAGCGKSIDTILLYRATWMERLVWKSLFLASIPLAPWLALRHAETTQSMLLWLLATPTVGGIVGGFVLSRVLAFPFTLLTDRIRGIRSK